MPQNHFLACELFRKKVGAFWGSFGVYTHKRQGLIVALKETNFYLPILQLVWPDHYTVGLNDGT